MSQSGTDEKSQDMETTTAEDSSISLKLSPIWESDPENWFNMIELQFRLASISDTSSGDSKKVVHLLSALSPHIVGLISDVIKDPPQNELLYNILKNAILSRITPSDESKLETLLSKIHMGDRRPSELLRSIQQLAGTNFSLNIIKTLWTRRLPEAIRLAVISQPETSSLDQIAHTADRIFEAISNAPNIASSTHSFRPPLTSKPVGQSSGNKPPPTLISIAIRLDALEAKIAKLTEDRGRSRSRSNNYNRNWYGGGRSNSRSRNDNRNAGTATNNDNKNVTNKNWCRLHNVWGIKAHKCFPPCSFLKEQVNNLPKND